MAYILTEERRQIYRETSQRAQQRKLQLLGDYGVDNEHVLTVPRLNPDDLMPQIKSNGLSTLSLFSGGGGLDLGFERSGYEHFASYEILEICAQTLMSNRTTWKVNGGSAGDVTAVDWRLHKGIDVVQGGPPCQPFSIAGKQAGAEDPRNMWSQFVRCVLSVKPKAFIAENVTGLLDDKFADFVTENIINPLSGSYFITKFVLRAEDFGVPQTRKRVFFVGFKNKKDFLKFQPPLPTHGDVEGLLPRNTARFSLGLPDIGFDTIVPTLRSGFTGPRKTTSVVNSQASMQIWNRLNIWPHGVQISHEKARAYPPENGHHRLSAMDCGVLQGFPNSWKFEGAAYQIIGQIGNSVCPPVGYSVAKAVASAFGVK